ncbi:metallophosphoesterase family protein [Myceligenerans crystallogenes]|uniref:Calcineurin-like phosphoesterase n=1 Tax=Myceligenerans crystallogenes TaxID=316335 RepID=A0ABN2N2W8_9MICO
MNSLSTTRGRGRGLRIVAGIVGAGLVAGVLGTSLLTTEARAAAGEPTDLVLGVGSDETQRKLAWYTSLDTTQVAQLAPAAQVVNGVFPSGATTVPATGGPTTSGEYNRFATLSGLQPNTSYAYRVGSETAWSAIHTFRTQAFTGDLDLLFYGDPQIGSSGNVTSDAAGWSSTLDVSLAAYPDAEMIFSGGDQVETATSETQYNAFLTPDALRRVPFVATNGNHDVGSKAYSQHFNVPNLDPTAGPGTSTTSGGDYWFTYKDVLFVNLNSNSLDLTSHERFLRDVLAAQGASTAWTVVAFHHSIYSAGPHSTDTSIVTRRNTWASLFSELGVDLVVQGHDHSYARSYLMRNGAKADASEPAGASSVTAGPGGVLYLTANSASGSKYYALKSTKPGYASVMNQENVRNYTAVEFTGTQVSVKTLRSQAFGANPVNSVVDQVVLTREGTTPPPAGQTFTTVGTPTVSGTPRVGHTLTADPGTWNPAPAFTYQWLSNGSPVSGATGRTWTLPRNQRGDQVSVRVTGTLTGYTTTDATSSSVTITR